MISLRAVSRWAIFLAAGTSAFATTFDFSATVTSGNISNYVVGQVVGGTLTFDPTTTGSQQVDGSNIYLGTISNFQLAGVSLSGTQNQNSISVLPFSASGFNDVFDARLGTATSTLEFYLESDKNTGTLANGALPVTAPNLAAFRDPSAFYSTYVQFADFTNGYQHLDANLTSLFAVATPEPVSFALVIAGGMGLCVFSLRRDRYVTKSEEQK